jgi:thiol-disulfide isomerase/thioredoxin
VVQPLQWPIDQDRADFREIEEKMGAWREWEKAMSDRVRAPQLEPNRGWLNTDRPLDFAGELRGQVVILDFWTYCCINCIHILPDLAFLEDKYQGDPVTFIGVHSAKFSNEASRETIRAAILRYEIRHPVVVDDNMKIWRSYAVRSWPTLVVVDATGVVSFVAAGEGNRDVVDDAIAAALADGKAQGTLADGPVSVRREANVRATSGLAFPGKVLADPDLQRLFIADSNHNRIVVAGWPDPNGHATVLRMVGSGAIGAADGPSDTASFDHPQGLAAGPGHLYVADTENHLIRAIDLESFEVATIVGTGAMDNDRAGGGMGTTQGLNSPWDLAIEGSTLYVAMAGVHQIWRIDLPVGFARSFAGSGRENIVDGPTETSALAQPSGICILGDKVYFADSEVSAVRGIDMAAERVFTVIGEGLFSFGDVDGAAPKAKFQHPMGIEGWKNSLLVADTYNHKIKRVEPASRSSQTLYGTGRAGASTPDGELEIFEPGGLSVAGDELFVADTNNHRVVRVDLKTGKWQEIVLDGLGFTDASSAPRMEPISASAVALAAGGKVALAIHPTLPEGAHVNPEAPWSLRVQTGGKILLQHTGRSASLPLVAAIPTEAVTAGTWLVSVSFAYCTDGAQSLCIPAELAWSIPVTTDGSQGRVELSGPVDCDVPADVSSAT